MSPSCIEGDVYYINLDRNNTPTLSDGCVILEGDIFAVELEVNLPLLSADEVEDFFSSQQNIEPN